MSLPYDSFIMLKSLDRASCCFFDGGMNLISGVSPISIPISCKTDLVSIVVVIEKFGTTLEGFVTFNNFLYVERSRAVILYTPLSNGTCSSSTF